MFWDQKYLGSSDRIVISCGDFFITGFEADGLFCGIGLFWDLSSTVFISKTFLGLMLPQFKQLKNKPYLPCMAVRGLPQMHFIVPISESLWEEQTGTPSLLLIVACFWQKGHLLIWPCP
jgi:hypothetical protein